MVALKEVLLFRYYYLLAAVGRVTRLARLAMLSGGTIASMYLSRLLIKTLRYTSWDEVSMFLMSQQRTCASGQEDAKNAEREL